MNKKLYALCIAAWFIAWGLLSISNFQFDASGLILGLLAIAGGILLVLDR